MPENTMTHFDVLVKDINGTIATLGELICDIIIGDQLSLAFKEVNILVTSAITPILIGQNILKRSFTFGHTTQTSPLTPPHNHAATFKYNPLDGVRTTLTILTEKNCDHLDIAVEQLTDDLLSKIIKALQTKDLSQRCHMDPDDHRNPTFKKHFLNFYLEPGISVLMIRDSTHTPRLVVPYKLHSKFLYQAHDWIKTLRGHSHAHPPRQLLVGIQESWHWNIRGILWNLRWTKKKLWQTSISHCTRGKRPLDIIYMDFITMPVSKGKRHILTRLDSFSRHLTAVPRVRDATRGLNSFFLRHPNRIFWPWYPLHRGGI